MFCLCHDYLLVPYQTGNLPKQSGFLNNWCLETKSWQTKVLLLLTLSCWASLVLPPFLKGGGQSTEEQVIKCREMASLRIDVERVIRRIKNYRILQGITLSSSMDLSGKVFTVCSYLTNLHPPLVRTVDLILYGRLILASVVDIKFCLFVTVNILALVMILFCTLVCHMLQNSSRYHLLFNFIFIEDHLIILNYYNTSSTNRSLSTCYLRSNMGKTSGNLGKTISANTHLS